MCGIAGIVLDELDPRAAEWVTAMTQHLHHRGPDDGGAAAFGLGGRPVVTRALGPPGRAVEWEYLVGQAALGARRLAIVDLSPAGHQPMASDDGAVWLAFNGEIYNHAALREELTARGMAFRGRCDTEVFLSAYRAWGVDCFERLEGMWAAAIFDWREGRAVLARDRLGIKPLYVTRFEKGLAFASEIAALLTLPGAPREAGEPGLRDFLVRGLVDHTQETLFAGVHAFPPGCYAVLNLQRREGASASGILRRFWRLDLSPRDLPDAPKRVHDALASAVSSHLGGDVPVGTCLSGGIDSSSIVALLGRRTRESPGAWSQHAFTACLPGDALDETRFAEIAGRAAGSLQWHRVEPSAERLAAAMEPFVRHQGQPVGSASMYLQWEVMALAKQTGVKVLLDGQGGDELFCGYHGHVPPFLASLIRRGRIGAFLREYRAARRGLFADGGLREHIAAALLPPDWRDALRLRRDRATMDWLAPELFSVEEAPTLASALGWQDESGEATTGGGALEAELTRILLRESLPALLRYEDASSMAHSIEARVPFLDRGVLELAMQLPSALKIRDGVSKAVLRDAMRGLVPEEILSRRDKIGYGAPQAAWLRGALRDWWVDAVTSDSFFNRGCFRPIGVKALMERFDRGDDSAATPLWRMAMVETWARMHLD